MRKLVFIYIKAWMEHYEEEIGDGAAKRFYEWCIEQYLLDDKISKIIK
jgi:hypothetical protein